MGCDIHAYAEVYLNGQWQPTGRLIEGDAIENEKDNESICLAIGNIYRGRNYELFGELAGVRSDTTPISWPKGLPDDVSDQIASCSDEWGCDGHSHSYYCLEELLDNKHRLSGIKKVIKILERMSKIYNLMPDEIRIVFWFDN